MFEIWNPHLLTVQPIQSILWKNLWENQNKQTEKKGLKIHQTSVHEESSFCVSVMRNLGSLDFSLTAMQNFDTTLLQITNLHIGLSLRVNSVFIIIIYL